MQILNDRAPNANTFLSLSFMFLLCLGGGSSATAQRPNQKSKSSSVNATDPVADAKNGRLTLQQVVKMLTTRGYPALRITTAVQNRGLDFDNSPENVGALRQATNDDELFTFLRSKMLQEKARERVIPPTMGSVIAICEPVDCIVNLNGATAPVEGGRRVFPNVSPGTVTVSFSAERYEPQNKSVKVEVGKPVEVVARLKLTNLEEAKHWRDEMWKAVSAGERGEGAQEIVASGTATIYDVSGKETNWNLSIRFSATTSTMELRLPSGNKSGFIVECNGETDCKQQASKKKGGLNLAGGKSGIDAEMATLALRDFRRNHLGSILRKLSSSEIRIISTSQDAAGAHILHFKDSENDYEVRLTPNFLVAQVRIESNLKLGDVTVITYSEYESLDKTHAQYPTKTVYKSGEKRGFKAELTLGK